MFATKADPIQEHYMAKNTPKRTFVLVYLDLVESGLSYEEAAIVQYVERFEQSNKPCYASVPYIAKDLRLSERSTKRHIRHLLNSGHLKATGRGRGRFLHRNGAKMAPNEAKLAPVRGQNGTNEWCQNGTLSILDITNNNDLKELPKGETRLKDGVFGIEWDETRQCMVRKRLV